MGACFTWLLIFISIVMVMIVAVIMAMIVVMTIPFTMTMPLHTRTSHIIHFLHHFISKFDGSDFLVHEGGIWVRLSPHLMRCRNKFSKDALSSLSTLNFADICNIYHFATPALVKKHPLLLFLFEFHLFFF